MVTVRRGDVVLCDLNPVVGTEQAGVRPVVVLQIDRANAVSPHTIIAPFTTKIRRAFPLFHAFVPAGIAVSYMVKAMQATESHILSLSDDLLIGGSGSEANSEDREPEISAANQTRR